MTERGLEVYRVRVTPDRTGGVNFNVAGVVKVTNTTTKRVT